MNCTHEEIFVLGFLGFNHLLMQVVITSFIFTLQNRACHPLMSFILPSKNDDH